jgi:hypothetical protein
MNSYWLYGEPCERDPCRTVMIAPLLLGALLRFSAHLLFDELDLLVNLFLGLALAAAIQSDCNRKRQ